MRGPSCSVKIPSAAWRKWDDLRRGCGFRAFGELPFLVRLLVCFLLAFGALLVFIALFLVRCMFLSSFPIAFKHHPLYRPTALEELRDFSLGGIWWYVYQEKRSAFGQGSLLAVGSAFLGASVQPGI